MADDEIAKDLRFYGRLQEAFRESWKPPTSHDEVERRMRALNSIMPEGIHGPCADTAFRALFSELIYTNQILARVVEDLSAERREQLFSEVGQLVHTDTDTEGNPHDDEDRVVR